MGKYCFGIDVGGTSVKCGLFQTDGVLVEKWEIPTRKENSGEAILPDIAKTILDKIAERKLDKSDVDGVGIGVPGPVNERGEVPCAVNLFWGFKEVTKELTELTGLPSKAGNDANVAALASAPSSQQSSSSARWQTRWASSPCKQTTQKALEAFTPLPALFYALFRMLFISSSSFAK